MKTLFNSTYSKGCVNLRIKRHIVGTASEMDEAPFSVETLAGANNSFHGILLETIDDADRAGNEKRTANG